MKKPTEKEIITGVLNQVDFLLKDWSSNIKHYDIVREDFLQRIKTGLPKYIEVAQLNSKQ